MNRLKSDQREHCHAARSVGSGIHRVCSPSIFHGYSEVAALGHASFNLARSTRAVKTPNPRRPIAFPCCRRLLYMYSKSFPVLLSFPLSFLPTSATLSSCPRLEIPSSEILDFRGRCFCCEIVVLLRNKIARTAANITCRNPRSFVRAFHFVRPSATKSDVYRTSAYARFRLVSIDSTGARHEPKLVPDNSL